MTTLVLLEVDRQSIKQASRSAIAAAKRFGPVHALLIGRDGFDDARRLEGVERLFHAPDVPSLAEPISALIATHAIAYTHIVGAATAFGKNILPRVAGLLDVQPIPDVVDIIDDATFVRPIYAGNALATVRSRDPIKILTIRTAQFSPVALRPGEETPVEPLLSPAEPDTALADARFVRLEENDSERPDLETARVVISGGRGLKDAANFKLLEPIADKLNAAIGASRAAVDAGFAPNEIQVGQTGKIVAPDLYIAVGLSGALQHLAGMKDSRVIVAINMDPEAPIFRVADYALVGDLFEVLPELEAALNSQV